MGRRGIKKPAPMEMDVVIPYTPRYRGIHKILEAHRFGVLVAHRRFGKTVLVINHLVRMSTRCEEKDGHYAYIAPYRNQAKDVAWTYLKRYTAPIPGRVVNESELYVQVPARGGSAKIRIFGADNPDALRGLYFDGVVMDEVAQMKPEVWEEIIRPALADRSGWAVFIGTPKGPNLFQDIYQQALKEEAAGNPDWCAMCYRVDQSNAIPPKELEALKVEMSEAKFAQEMMCDFSASADDVLIPADLVADAQARHLEQGSYEHMPLVMGVDVARFGDDASVITFRQGVYCESQITLRQKSTMELAGHVARLWHERHPDALFVDGVGVGAGVVDRLRELGIDVVDVQAGSRALDNTKYLNRRAEMWTEMRDWLKAATIPPDPVLAADLTALTYSYNSSGALVLEKKEDAKERLRRSPDHADSLALTFAQPVVGAYDEELGIISHEADMTYDPLAW